MMLRRAPRMYASIWSGDPRALGSNRVRNAHRGWLRTDGVESNAYRVAVCFRHDIAPGIFVGYAECTSAAQAFGRAAYGSCRRVRPVSGRRRDTSPGDLVRCRDEWCSGRRGRRRFGVVAIDRKSTRLNSSHRTISYAVFCLKKKKKKKKKNLITYYEIVYSHVISLTV